MSNQKNTMHYKILTRYHEYAEMKVIRISYGAEGIVTEMPNYAAPDQFRVVCDYLRDITYMFNKRSITLKAD